MARHSSPRPPSAPFFTPPAFPFGAFGALAPAGGPAPIRPAWSPQPSRPARPARPTPPPASGPARPVPESAALVHGGHGATGLRPTGAPGAGPSVGSGPSLPSGEVPPLRRPATVPPPPPGSPQEPRDPRARRRPAPAPTTGGALRSRLAVAAVAAGALATAGHSVAGLGALDAPTTETTADALALRANATAAGPGAGASASALDAATTGVLAATAVPAVARTDEGRSQVSSLSKSRKLAEAAAAREAAAKAPSVKLAQGRFTSGFGARWGTSHNGVDIANAIGTPILAPDDGVVTAAGPASGFGLWVKVRHADGNETVYGHINRAFVSTGDRVKAGEQIAEIGNRGQSTGPHVHFEVHTPGGKKINPQPWLAERGISLGASKD